MWFTEGGAAGDEFVLDVAQGEAMQYALVVLVIHLDHEWHGQLAVALQYTSGRDSWP